MSMRETSVSEDFVTPPHDAEPERTGNVTVDQVLDGLGTLEEAPVAEHVAFFEQAHERLRAALEDAGEDRSPA
jgi:hypothetical protein